MNSNQNTGKLKRGVLLLNLGGPVELKDVKPFLYNLFSDPDILVGVPTPFRQTLAFLISQVKGSSSKKIYQAIGGGSPQLRWTRTQAELLTHSLNSNGSVEVKVTVGMRAWNPTIDDGLKELREWGADEVVLFPLFPQFSTTTTGSCFKEARRCLKRMGWDPKIREVHSWPDDENYIRLLRKTVDEAIDVALVSGSVHVLFSAHSLPMSVIERGDPYPEHVDRTIKAVANGLEHPWSLAFQSRNGPVPWLKPYTEDEIERLGQAGVKQIVVVPVSFVSDHIETLYELDQLYADHARSHGITGYFRSRSFNDDPHFIEVMARQLHLN